MPRRLIGFLIIFIIFAFIGFSLFTTDNGQHSNSKTLGEAVQPTITPNPAVSSGATATGLPIPSLQNSGSYYNVIKVVDGDTFSVEKEGLKETVRLIGLNTPESVDPRRPVECFGKEASNFAKQILSGQLVRLVNDPSQSDRDKYNRILRYTFLEDGTFVNKKLIEEGYAYEYTYGSPYQYQAEFKAAQTAAQQKQKGLWAKEGCETRTQLVPTTSIPKQVSGDKDCSDFSTQKEAQDFFIANGGPASDPHKLDSDKDGTVCETLP